MPITLPFTTNIAGVSFNNEDGSSRQELVKHLFTGERIYLKDDSSSMYPEAIGVYNSIDEKLGYISRIEAQQIRNQNIDFQSLYCLVKSSGRSTYSNLYGVTISIGRTRESALSILSNLEQRISEGSNYKPPYTSPSSYSHSSYSSLSSNNSKSERYIDAHKALYNSTVSNSSPMTNYSQYKQSGNAPKEEKSVPWGCLIPSIIGAVLAIVVIKVFGL